MRPVDKMKDNEPKTFAFITFAREDAAKQLVKMVRFYFVFWDFELNLNS